MDKEYCCRHILPIQQRLCEEKILVAAAAAPAVNVNQKTAADRFEYLELIISSLPSLPDS
jgi:hypothetical protein